MQNLIYVIFSPVGFTYPIIEFDAELLEKMKTTIRG